ncbi:MAG: hypothetical protein HY298_10115 [Verrucomicrobia bacterium]|nr:hypothetical protein [Verrucomicrobiota bacterium]
MTLVETVIAVGIGSLVLAVIATFSIYSGRNFASMGNYVELDNASRKTLDQMIREIRGTTGLTAFQTNRLAFLDSDGTSLIYTYDPAQKTLTRFKPTSTNTLLTNCVSLQFGIYQRTPQTGGGGFVATTNPVTCKLVDLTWKCVRTNYLSTRLNTESVQTAKIVIRNKH